MRLSLANLRRLRRISCIRGYLHQPFISIGFIFLIWPLNAPSCFANLAFRESRFLDAVIRVQCPGVKPLNFRSESTGPARAEVKARKNMSIFIDKRNYSIIRLKTYLTNLTRRQ
jgi:hypothetical protein